MTGKVWNNPVLCIDQTLCESMLDITNERRRMIAEDVWRRLQPTLDARQHNEIVVLKRALHDMLFHFADYAVYDEGEMQVVADVRLLLNKAE